MAEVRICEYDNNDEIVDTFRSLDEAVSWLIVLVLNSSEMLFPLIDEKYGVVIDDEYDNSIEDFVIDLMERTDGFNWITTDLLGLTILY